MLKAKLSTIILVIIYMLSLSNFISNKASQTPAPYIITVFIRPLWENPTINPRDIKKTEKKISTPDRLTCSLIENEQKKCRFYSGIIATYSGYSTITSNTGQLVFPRYNPTPEISIVVSQAIQPIPEALAQSTIHHWQVTNSNKAAYYKAQLIKDPETELYYWHINKVDVKSAIIPQNTLIIFANPKHIIIPTGNITTPSITKLNQTNTNLVLPDFYSTRDIDSIINSLRFLKVKKFFEPLTKEYKYYPDQSTYSEKIVDL